MAGLEKLFDSNIVMDSLNGIEAAHVELSLVAMPAISIVTWIEVLAHPVAGDTPEVRTLLSSFQVIPLSAEIAERSALIRRTVRCKLPDAVILATAQVLGITLVTRNTRDFGKLSGNILIPYMLPVA